MLGADDAVGVAFDGNVDHLAIDSAVPTQDGVIELLIAEPPEIRHGEGGIHDEVVI